MVETRLNATVHEVLGDAGRLQQIFWNLVKNAIKFTPRGGQVTVRSSNPSPGTLRVEVTDNGIGIPAGRLEQLFTPFEQGGLHVTQQFGGLGLGLAISKALVDMHRGTISAASDGPGLGATFTLDFPEGFCQDLAIGASVATDGVCLTVTEILSPTQANFDVMLQSLNITTLGSLREGDRVNVERAAKDGAEIGGHPLSGHVDFTGTLVERREFDNNLVWRVAVPEAFRRYIFAKGYIAIHGASLTVAEVNRQEGWFEIWMIPETRRATVFEHKKVGDRLNIEIERSTQVVVDTVREAVQESLGRLQPVLEALLKEKGLSLDDFVQAPVLPH